MIISKLKGGLGNQMFQWAFGKHLSNKYNVPFYIDVNFYKQYTKRTYSLGKFPNLNCDFIENIVNNGKEFSRFNEPYRFTNLEYKESNNYYLDGYFQSEKYFLESSDLIRSELYPSDLVLKKLNLTPFIESNAVSLHVRRTDYLTSNGYHPVQSIDYYKKGLDIIGDYDNIFVFSDDINWCKKNLKFDNMIFMEGFDDVEDLWLMSMCRNNIIANSSFSWWGAWLNSNPDKKVIAPNNWFGYQANLSSDDIIPNNWIKI